MASPRNLILSALPVEDWAELAPLLERVSLRRRQVLTEPRTDIPYIYFIEHGLAALQARTQADGAHGVGLLGRFGMTGLPLVLGTKRSPLRIVVQTAGEAYRLKAGDAEALFSGDTALRRLALAYVQVRMVHAAQVALCNAHHPVEERVRRWLLLAHDLLGEDEICVSHATIAGHLGMRRPSVSEQVKRLERAGLVSQSFACITVRDRAGLEQDACECHRLVWAEYRRLREVVPRSPFGRSAYPHLASTCPV
ncbi:Crp/Fnr family transcriptional regulator [Methylobacterium sp. P31]